MRQLLILLMIQFSFGLTAQNNFTFHYNKGVESFNKGEYSEAIGNFNNALKYRKESNNQYKVAGALKERALSKMHLKNYSSALKDIDEALELVEDIKPELTYLIHMSHQFGFHEDMEAKLPAHVRVSYDGLKINI